MDNRYYENVINEMQPFFEENNFKANEDGSFASDKKSAKIEYNEPRQMYTLSVADIEDGTISDYSEISAWLFDDSQNAKDAVSVGIDFVNSLRSNLGIKIKRAINADTQIELPTASKNGSMNMNGFTKKVLDVFPAFKDVYKAHIAKYGNFLYLNFFGQNLVPQIKAILKEGNKKQIKKLFDLLEDSYVHGDKDTVNLTVAVLAAAAYNDEAMKNAVKAMISEDKHFTSSFDAFLPSFSKNKKLISVLVV